MTKQELLDLLNLHALDSAAAWAAALHTFRIGPLQDLETNAANSATGFRIAIEQIEKAIPDIPAAKFNLGGARHLDVNQLSGGGTAANAAMDALLQFDAETHEAPDTVAGTGT